MRESDCSDRAPLRCTNSWMASTMEMPEVDSAGPWRVLCVLELARKGSRGCFNCPFFLEVARQEGESFVAGIDKPDVSV